MKGKIKIANKKRFITFLAICLFVVALITITVDFIKYPEVYLPTWKKALRDDLANGNQTAIEYYNDNYIVNGKHLYGDKYIVEEEYINLASVVGYDSTEDGILLHTNDGNGYFIAK